MSEVTRLFVEFLGGEDPCVTEQLEESIGEFLSAHALAEPDDVDAGKNILDQLEETLVDFGEERFIHLPPFLVDHLFEFAARFLPKSSFAVLIMDHPLRAVRVREYRSGSLAFSQGPFL